MQRCKGGESAGAPGTSWPLGEGVAGEAGVGSSEKPGALHCSWVSVPQAGGLRGSDWDGVRTLHLSLWKGDWKGMRLPVWKL